jgi:glycosyltransferase involved in cell wall biosynthesis
MMTADDVASGVVPRRCSVIIPAYNVEPYVAEAVESALAQDYPDVEVVVVDDGSTDATAAVLAAFGDRITVVRQGNAGLAAARNAGVRSSTGEFLAMLDADDTCDPSRVRRCIEVLDARSSRAVVTTDAWVIDDRTPTDRGFYESIRWNGLWPPGNHAAAMIQGNFVFGAVVLRRDLFDEVGWYDPDVRRLEDYELFCRLLIAGATFELIDERLYGYRRRPGSLTAETGPLWDDYVNVMTRHLPALARLAGRGYGRQAYWIATQSERVGDRRCARQFLRLAWRDPALAPSARIRVAAKAFAPW